MTEDPVHAIHSIRADRSGTVGTTYTCTCGRWDGWATGPTSTDRLKAEWRAHVGLSEHIRADVIKDRLDAEGQPAIEGQTMIGEDPDGPVIEGQTVLGVVHPEDQP